ncbi:hypothetical protein [Propionivibrio sp.]|uniref:hypothetical protein n=1 Tax=Propionivibrio sp. TaxID=2212460 RepID=UPI00272EB225|nr:hypothetical protein [Propionivibrio sp.]
MHTEELTIPDLDLPFVDLDIPEQELVLEELPGTEVLLSSRVVLSPPLTINQTLFSERICIRINRSVLSTLKKQAAEQGVRYQTFINLLLAQHAAL